MSFRFKSKHLLCNCSAVGCPQNLQMPMAANSTRSPERNSIASCWFWSFLADQNVVLFGMRVHSHLPYFFFTSARVLTDALTLRWQVYAIQAARSVQTSPPSWGGDISYDWRGPAAEFIALNRRFRTSSREETSKEQDLAKVVKCFTLHLVN